MSHAMTEFQQTVSANLDRVREQIQRAARRSNRKETDVRLIAVTKYLSVEQTAQLVELGCVDLGESRPQVLWEKAGRLNQEIDWHLIGHLQRNKIRKTAPHLKLIHSVDSLPLIEALEQALVELGHPLSILLELNVSGDSSKDGFQLHELNAAFERISQCRGLKIEGMMCMGGLQSNERELRREFTTLREVRDGWRLTTGLELPQLSMGMSADFEIAIEEGATLVRIGSILYEGAI